MSLALYRPFDVWRDFDSGLNKLLNWPDTCAPAASNSEAVRWTPRVDVREEESRFVVSADIPGVDPKDVEVTFEDGLLSVSGERKFESTAEKDGYHRVERSYGKFARHFRLPSTVDADGISAEGKNGVLEIGIPKSEKAKPKRIEIQ